MNELTIPIKKLSEDAVLPTKAHATDAGFDLYSVQDIKIRSGEVVKIETGIAMNIPIGYVGLIMDKSGMGSKGFKVFGGVIDAGYTGEIIVCLGNMTSDYVGDEDGYDCDYKPIELQIKKGQKIAQLVIVENSPFISFEQVEDFSKTERAEKGFGSSGL